MTGSVVHWLLVSAGVVSLLWLPGLRDTSGATAAPQNRIGSDAEQEQVAEPQFSRERGFYDAPLEVAITCKTPGATIIYTLDGNEPADASGPSLSSKVYAKPLRLAKTTCLRAQAVRAGWIPGSVATHTYIFLNDVIARTHEEALAQGYPDTWYDGCPADYGMDPEVCYSGTYASLMDDALLSIPTVSLVMNRDSLFSHSKDPQTGGIYIYPGDSSTGGSGWERPVSVEFFTVGGSKQFQVDCGLQIQGDESRNPLDCPKHSFGLRLNSRYGRPRLDFPLFDDRPVGSFDSLQLQGFFSNSWHHWAVDQRQRAQYVRDQWIRDSLLEMGHMDAGRGLYVHLYLNGIYWGLYNLCEQVDAEHYARYNGGSPERLDAVDGDPTYAGPGPGRLLDGTMDAWLELQRTVADGDWDRINAILDVNSLIDWSILNGLAGTQDIRRGGHWRAVGGGPDRMPWRFYSWDAERALESMNHNTVNPAFDPTGLLGLLDDIEEFRVRYGDRLHKHLLHGGVLTAERNAERWLRRTKEIEQAIIAESARWGDYRRDVQPTGWGPYYLYTRDAHWIPAGNRVLADYFPRRTGVVLEQFISRGLYPSVEAPAFHVGGVPQHGGQVAPGSGLSMQAPSGVVWYTLDGQDPRRPAQGARVIAVHTLVAEDAAKRVLVPEQEIDGSWKGGASFNDSFWTAVTGTPGGVGYEQSAGYESLISLDVNDWMFGKNRSCYIRIPFRTDVDPAKLGHMMLKIRYDDGFIAYLNGREMLRVLFQGTPTWDCGSHGTHEADDAELFVVSGSLHLLRRGDNILAIHGMNSATDSFDFLISACLEAVESAADRDSGLSGAAIRYDGPVTLDRTTRVRARVLSDGDWSALTEAVFTIPPGDGR